MDWCDKPDATNQMPQARCGNNHPQVVFVFRLSGLPRSWCPFFTIIFLQCWAKFRIDMPGLHCHLAIYHNYGKPLCWKGKYSINEHFFHTYVGVPEHILKQKTCITNMTRCNPSKKNWGELFLTDRSLVTSFALGFSGEKVQRRRWKIPE